MHTTTKKFQLLALCGFVFGIPTAFADYTDNLNVGYWVDNNSCAGSERPAGVRVQGTPYVYTGSCTRCSWSPTREQSRYTRCSGVRVGLWDEYQEDPEAFHCERDPDGPHCPDPEPEPTPEECQEIWGGRATYTFPDQDSAGSFNQGGCEVTSSSLMVCTDSDNGFVRCSSEWTATSTSQSAAPTPPPELPEGPNSPEPDPSPDPQPDPIFEPVDPQTHEHDPETERVIYLFDTWHRTPINSPVTVTGPQPTWPGPVRTPTPDPEPTPDPDPTPDPNPTPDPEPSPDLELPPNSILNNFPECFEDVYSQACQNAAGMWWHDPFAHPEEENIYGTFHPDHEDLIRYDEDVSFFDPSFCWDSDCSDLDDYWVCQTYEQCNFTNSNTPDNCSGSSLTIGSLHTSAGNYFMSDGCIYTSDGFAYFDESDLIPIDPLPPSDSGGAGSGDGSGDGGDGGGSGGGGGGSGDGSSSAGSGDGGDGGGSGGGGGGSGDGSSSDGSGDGSGDGGDGGGSGGGGGGSGDGSSSGGSGDGSGEGGTQAGGGGSTEPGGTEDGLAPIEQGGSGGSGGSGDGSGDGGDGGGSGGGGSGDGSGDGGDGGGSGGGADVETDVEVIGDGSGDVTVNVSTEVNFDDSGIIAAINSAASNIMSRITDAASNLLSGLSGLLSQLIDTASNIYQAVIDLPAQISSELSHYFNDLSDQLAGIENPTAEEIADAINPAFDQQTSQLKAALDSQTSDLSAAIDGQGQAIDSLASSISDLVDSLASSEGDGDGSDDVDLSEIEALLSSIRDSTESSDTTLTDLLESFEDFTSFDEDSFLTDSDIDDAYSSLSDDIFSQIQSELDAYEELSELDMDSEFDGLDQIVSDQADSLFNFVRNELSTLNLSSLIPSLPGNTACNSVSLSFMGQQFSVECRVFETVRSFLSWVIFIWATIRIYSVIFSVNRG